jgi:hypothetical protein
VLQRLRPARLDRRTGAFLVVLAALAAVLCVAPLYRATLWLEQPNEGWNAMHALNAFTTDLYPPRSSLIINNYPPLSFYLIGALAKISGEPIFPGRVVALLAFAGVAAALFAAARRLGLSFSAAAVGALGFVAVAAALFSSYVGLDEPQMLAHALSIAGAAVLVGARRRRSFIAAALLMVAGLLVKQVAVGLPLACAAWLAFRRRDFFWLFALTGAAAGLAALSLLLAIYGESFVQNMTAPRYFSLERLDTNLGLAWRAIAGLIAFAGPALAQRWRLDDAQAFAGLAIAGGFAVILLFGAALGVSINVAFDLVIASSLGLAVGWERAASAFGAAGAWRWRTLVAVVLVARCAIGAPSSVWAAAFDPAGREQLGRASAEGQALRDRIAGLKGPVVCETLSICVWAGKPSAADLWKLRHEETLSFLDTRGLLEGVSAARYAGVVTFSPLTGPASDGSLSGLSGALSRAYEPPINYPGAGVLYLAKTAP